MANAAQEQNGKEFGPRSDVLFCVMEFRRAHLNGFL